MLATIKKVVKRTLWTGATLTLGAVAVPFGYEAAHNELQQTKVETALNKIVQEKFFICDPSAATTSRDDRDRKLYTIIKDAYGDHLPRWNKLGDIYFSGVKRITNTMPSAMKGLEAIGVKIPYDYHKGNYRTALDDLTAYSTNLGSLGIGICFDGTNLPKLGAGSAYVRDEGVVTLNPELPPDALTIHVRRQFHRLDLELVTPYDRLVTDGKNLRSTFAERFGQIRKMAGLFDGAVVTLPAKGDPKTAVFKDVARRDYAPPFIKPQPSTPSPQPKPASKG